MTKKVFRSASGTPYLKDPVATCIGKMQFTLTPATREFLLDYDPSFEVAVRDYQQVPEGKDDLALGMFAGQLCYLSFGEKRTSLAEGDRYMGNIRSAGHGSVLEHANFSFLVYGIDRATTHELVRHRVGFAVSQVSQRFVDANRVRFVLPWEDQDQEGEELFQAHIDRAVLEYEERTERLKKKYPRHGGETPTDHRKRIQSSARSVLPNDVEAPVVITINGRSSRHIVALRTSEKADVRIRRPMIEILRNLQQLSPEFYGDFSIYELSDGSFASATPFPKP